MDLSSPETSCAPIPGADARLQDILRAYAWATPRLGALSVEIAASDARGVAVLLCGAPSRPKVVVGFGADARHALENAALNASSIRAAFLQVPASDAAPSIQLHSSPLTRR